MKIFKLQFISYISIFVFATGCFFALKNTYVLNSYFFIANISIREAFFYKNDVNFKGTHIPGERYFNILFKNIENIKNLNIKEISNTFKKIKNFDIRNNQYYLDGQ